VRSGDDRIPCAVVTWSWLAALALALFGATPALAVDVPPEGSCAVRPLRVGEDAVPGVEDVVPPAFRPGEKIAIDALQRLSSWLPAEVWERRDLFFFEGMQLEVGPCYRRYPAAPFFVEATRAHAGKAELDAEGNLVGYAGTGLPFAPETISDGAADAAARWAWNYRYRYQGAGERGAFRITQLTRGRAAEGFAGRFFFVPLHGVPGVPDSQRDKRFAAGGSFREPEVARGLAWRQYQLAKVDVDHRAADEVFVYLPGQRKVRRAPPQQNEGIFVPSYTRARSVHNTGMTLNEQMSDVGNPAIAASEPIRTGFVGLLIRPNAWTWSWGGARDVLAPANGSASGYPVDAARNFGPSGLSPASDRWELRRAIVLYGERKAAEGEVKHVDLWIDALTQQPLYWISRKANKSPYEVGIFTSRFSADDVLDAKWEGSGTGFGVMLPVLQTFAVAGQGGGWRRESYDLRTDPPSEEEAREFLSTQDLVRKGR
jgi:hypothetical protein